jgi:acyl transferase domain-containing protein/acyl carrier protein
MVSVALPVGEVEGRLEGWDGRVSLAAVNGPGSVVVSGEREALDGFLLECEGDGVRAREIPVGYASHSAQIEEIRDELLDACVGIVPRSGGVPFYSTVTGGLLDTAELDAGYWYRNLRETVRFDGVTRVLLGEGRRVFVEVGPHPVLSVAVQETVDEVVGEAVVVGSLRRGEGGAERFLASLAEVWVRGVEVDWARVFPDSARRVGLPTYAFQRERYWLMGSPGAGDVASIGQAAAGHPLLGASVGLAGGEEWLFTGRISLESHAWLADHMVMGVVLLPGTAFLELALHAGGQVGCGVVQELTLEAPLVLGEHDEVALQVSVGEPGEAGARSLGIYSRAAEQEWTRHASGTLAAEVHAAVEDRDAGIEARAGVLGGSWPPADAEPVDVDGLYDRLAKRGLEYGPAFQGLRHAWRRGNEVFAEVLLSEGEQREAEAFGVHPALLDAALHIGSVGAAEADGDGDGAAVRLPFSFGGVSLYTRGASTLRVCLSLAGDGAPSLTVANEAGELVARADSLVAREVSATLLSAASSAGSQSSLYRLSWRQVSPAKGPVMEDWVLLGDEQSAIAAALKTANPGLRVHRDLQAIGEAAGDGVGDDMPSVVFVDLRHDSSSGIDGVCVPELVRRIASGALELMQQWISDERFASSRMVLLTQDAAAVRVTDAPDADAPDAEAPDAEAPDAEGPDAEAVHSKQDVVGLAQSSVWGLVRSAQLESPGRFVLIDVYDDEACWGGLGGALALGEPQLAVREGELFIPRLARAGALPYEGVTGIDPDGTVLITGGTGVLGGLLARRLVSHHGVGHLLLTSRQGEEAQGASELRTELESLGANVRVAACDVADSDQLAGLLDSIAEEHPLRGVVHAAGAIDDGVIGSLTAERLDGVFAPKADAAWYLHQLTEHLDLSLFVLLSSVAGTLGSPGQGNYAAANAFLDALVAHRRARGLSGMSMAWGLWEQASGLTGALSETDRSRMKHSGMSALSSEEGLELFDVVLGGGEALMLPVSLDLAGLRAQARTGTLPAIFAGLVRVPTRRPSDHDASFARRLAAVPEAEREGFTLDMVRGEVAAVLGHSSAGAIDAQRAFKDLGFDSLAAVELRNRLNAATGLRLPATLVFDYPTTTALASHLLLEIAQPPTMTADSLNADLDRLERILASIAIDDTERAKITARLQALSGLSEGQAAESKVMVAQRLQSASADEVFDFIDNGLSRSAAERSPIGETSENGNG